MLTCENCCYYNLEPDCALYVDSDGVEHIEPIENPHFVCWFVPRCPGDLAPCEYDDYDYDYEYDY